MSLSRMLAHYSYKILRLASVLAVLQLGGPVLAQTDDEYSVDKVNADADGKDTSEARAKAMAQAEQEAFKQLLTKLAPDKAAEIIAKTPSASISTMVHGFEVVEERMTADHYHAVLQYHFSPQAIQSLLPAAAPVAAKVEQQPANPVATRKAVLVVPILNESRGVFKLWQEDNKWRNIWYEAALESGSGLVVVPLGDINDRVDVDDTNAASATYQSLSRLYDRYGVGEVYILTAYYNLKADPKPALEISTRRISPAATESSRSSYTIRTTENLDLLMVRAANDIAKNIYKQQTIDKTRIEFQRQKEINARVNVGSISEWVSLRKHLLAHGNIVGIRLTSINNSQTSMIISYKGTPEMLGKTLVASGLRVMQDGDSLVLATQ